jgi:tetratricopeptide (TPR) repeat protein
VHDAPQLAAAHYYLAIAQSWRAPPTAPAMAEIDKAIALGVDDEQRGLLEAVRALVKQDYIHGIELLRPLAEKYPDDREVLYVLFESLFHGGRPTEAMSLYHRIVALEPRFRLALVHALTYYIARGDDAGMTWALQLGDPTGDAYNRIWEPRILVARREYTAAIRLLSRMIDESTGPSDDLQLELATVYVLNDQLDLATEIVKKLAAANASAVAMPLMALASAHGDEAERKHWLEAALRNTTLQPLGPPRNIGVQFVLVPALLAADHDELADMSQRIEESIVPDYGRALNLNLTQALLAEQLADRAKLAKLADSPYPEVGETAKAALARLAGDRKAASEATRRAIAATGDARYLIDLYFLLASDLHALGDRAGMAAACDEVIRARLFSWAWTATAPRCKKWLAEPTGAPPPTR